METQQEQPSTDIVQVADEATEIFYWYLFNKEIGSRFHSFLEWVGVMREYVKMVKESGVEPFYLNTHWKTAHPVAGPQLQYMAEKLNCILAPFLNAASEEDKKAFVRILLEGK